MAHEFDEGDQVTYVGNDDIGTIVELAGRSTEDSDMFYVVCWDNGRRTLEVEHALMSL